MSLKLVPKEGLTGDVLLREAVSDFKSIIDLVRVTLAKRLYPAQQEAWVTIEAIYADRVIIEKDGKKIQFPYTIDADNTVSFGEGVQVVEDYVPVVTMKESAPLEASRFIEAAGKPEEGKWLIKVVECGVSKNNWIYTDVVLREGAPLFNGARVFVKPDDEHLKGGGKSFDQLEGGLSDARFIEGATPNTGYIQAVLTFIDPNSETAVKVREAYSRNLTGLFGFSIDVDGKAKRPIQRGNRTLREATKITKVSSVDLIVEPGAGGELIRMVESFNPNMETDMWKQRALNAVMLVNPGKFAGRTIDDIGDDELDAAFREAVASGQNSNSGGTSPEVVEQVRMVEARANMRTTVGLSTLPQAAKDKLLKDFLARESFVDADVDAAITGEREYLARFVESGRVNLNFDEAARVEDRSVRMAGMLDAFFDPAHADHRNTHSIREAYIEITGDVRVTGHLRNCDRVKMREALGGDVHMREAVDSSTFAQVLGDAITRRMQAIYVGQTDTQAWRRVCITGRVSDFRTQRATRVGGYGNLSVVAEKDPYPPMGTPGDDEALWKVDKRGGTEEVTFESIKNDDVRLISRIPQELSLAAANTLNEFVFDFYRTNPLSWDGVALYHATHNNLFANAFSGAEFKLHRLAMQKQTRAGSGKRLANSPAMLLVPFELQDSAYDTFVRGTNNDKTFVQNLNPEIVTVDYWTDANDWVTLADPNKFPVLEIDFLDGQQEPELFVQDNPTSGSLFTNDVITYKIRHIYGGNLLVDAEKGTTKAVVV